MWYPLFKIWKSNKALLRQWWGVHASAPSPPVSVGGFPSRAIFQIKCRPTIWSFHFRTALWLWGRHLLCRDINQPAPPLESLNSSSTFFFLLPQIKSPSVWSVYVVCLCCLFMRLRRRIYFKAPVCPAPSPCFAFNWISAFLSFQRSQPFDIFPTHFPPVCVILRPFLSSALCLAIPIICLWGPLFEMAFLLSQSQVSAVCLGYYIFGSSPNHWRTQLRAKMNPYHFISTKGSWTFELVDWLVVKNFIVGWISALGLDPCLFGLCFKS